MATTTLLPDSDSKSYDYVIVGGGTAGTYQRSDTPLRHGANSIQVA